jgi:gas vesicle protein
VLGGLLLAPKPGRETRQMLKNQAGALRDQASQYATSLRDGQQDGAREQHGLEAMPEMKVRPPRELKEKIPLDQAKWTY